MHALQIEIQIIAIIAAIACSILGVFLVLRKTAMLADAVSHSILPGLVIGFLVTHNLNHPLLIAMAALSGLIAVWSVNQISKSSILRVDAAIGLVFPFLFAIGIILIHIFADDIHLDTDAVLSGELVYAPFDRLYIAGWDVGPQAVWKGLSILLLIMLFVRAALPMIEIATFDPILSHNLGIPHNAIQNMIMILTALIVVTAFDIVGAVLVVGFIIIPPATAYLLTTNLKQMLYYSIALAVFSVLGGYFIAHILDVSIAGSIVSFMGTNFGLVYLFAPENGLLSKANRRKKMRQIHYQLTLLIHILSHEEQEERQMQHLHEHINWSEQQAKDIVRRSKDEGLIHIEGNVLQISSKGKNFLHAHLSQKF